MPSYSQIQAQIAKLQKEAQLIRKRELSRIIEKIKKEIHAYGLTADDLGLSTKRPVKAVAPRKPSRKKSQRGKVDKRSVVAPKYRDSSTGATWTGRGKQPKWLAAALKTGKKLEDFRI